MEVLIMKHYKLTDKKNGELIIYNNQSLSQYLNDYKILRENFNMPVIIDDNVTDCNRLFYKCHSFNQSIVIPPNVTDCSKMFYECYSFNQSIEVPYKIFDSYTEMFSGCKILTGPIIIWPDIKNYRYEFCFDMKTHGCKSITAGLFDINKPFSSNLQIIFNNLSLLEDDLLVPTLICILSYNLDFRRVTYYPNNAIKFAKEIKFDTSNPNFKSLIHIILNNITLPDDIIIKHFDELLEYAIKYDVEAAARLLNFKHEHWDEFPKNDLSLD